MSWGSLDEKMEKRRRKSKAWKNWKRQNKRSKIDLVFVLLNLINSHSALGLKSLPCADIRKGKEAYLHVSNIPNLAYKLHWKTMNNLHYTMPDWGQKGRGEMSECEMCSRIVT